ncbi:hypothetical protein DLJ53_17790 [Acuticoccus sediminis]|uniref:DUF1254 domain-containing protein n=1 Tax=Acuticoccus sediminis TaxID=2184697 RepID=A0A8B2NZ37_9HYPH|nr:DUF1254 domain-containing protein [Acuticoccus sediminis]RAI01068.1 hypothetical protein DLJ53_17790 [Acuticoccus sediminis]
MANIVFLSRRLGVLALLALVSLSASPLRAQDVTAEEAASNAQDAYLYFYPLITMDVTRKQMTNVPKPDGYAAPTNHFGNVLAYPSADNKVVVRLNFDTLYSSAWLDLTEVPVVISVPDTGGRYYLLPILDMWTDVFSSTGWRTTGTDAQTLLVAPQTWRPELRSGFDSIGLPADTIRVDAPTPHAWVIGRIKTDGEADYAAVNKIQEGLEIVPLSAWGDPAAEPADAPVDSSIDMKTPAKQQVDTMKADAYFSYAAELMKTNPPHLIDAPLLQRLERIGFIVGESYDVSAQSDVVQKAVSEAPARAQSLMQYMLPRLATTANGWSINTDTMGVYGVYYLKRAIVTQQGLGANRVADAVYPLNLVDADGQPLNGAHKYRIHFEKGELPPANAFWSVTLYDAEGYQVANSLNRFAVSSYMPFKTNSDGSLELYIQNESPAKEWEANWLPAPTGAFNLTMRLYAPKSDVLTGRWVPPAVKKATSTPGMVTQ